MFCKSRLTKLLYWMVCAAVAFGLASGCSTEHFKADADKEVYKIIDRKWQDSFGQKTNYTISDVPPSPNDIQIERAVPASGVINLAQAAAMATAHNRDYQTRKESLYLEALSLTDTRHKYALQWFGTIDSKYTNTYTEDEGREYEVEIGTGAGKPGELGAGVQTTQLLAGGIQIGTSLAINWLRFLTGDPRNTIGSVLISTVTIPLLGRGGGKVAWEELTQAERNVLYQIRTFNRYRKTFVVDVVNAYYGVLQKRDAVTNVENNYKRMVESKERLEMEAEAGRRTHIDVDEAEQRVLGAQDSYVRAQEAYKQSLDTFKMRLSLPVDADVELDQNELKALEEIGVSEIDYSPKAAIETALLHRLDLANTKDGVDDAARKVKLAADGLGPELNLTGGLDVKSREKTDFSQLQFHEGIYTLGFNADSPFDRKAERNAYRSALITLQQQQRQYEEQTENVKLNVRRAYRQLRETAERHRIQTNSLMLANNRVESNKLLLDAGRVTVRILLESQDALLNAQNNVTAALINHLDAKLSFFRDVGILQVRPDGMWEQRIPQSAVSEPVNLGSPDGMDEQRTSQSAVSELVDLGRPDGMWERRIP